MRPRGAEDHPITHGPHGNQAQFATEMAVAASRTGWILRAVLFTMSKSLGIPTQWTNSSRIASPRSHSNAGAGQRCPHRIAPPARSGSYYTTVGRRSIFENVLRTLSTSQFDFVSLSDVDQEDMALAILTTADSFTIQRGSGVSLLTGGAGRLNWSRPSLSIKDARSEGVVGHAKNS
jgi:hypothetical protein